MRSGGGERQSHDALAALAFLLGRLGGIAALQHLTAQCVNSLALLIHHVVVLEQILADVEVVPLDLLLRILDDPRDDAGLDGYVFLHTQPFHDARDALRSEDSHQIVLEGQEESGAARIALPPRASPQLVVDAPRVVALRSEDVQSPRFQDVLLLEVALQLVARERLLESRLLLGRQLVPRLAGILGIDVSPRHELGVASQDDVGPASRHVGRYGDGAAAGATRAGCSRYATCTA